MCPFTNGGGPGELALDLILYEIIGMALPNKSKSIDNTHRDLIVDAIGLGNLVIPDFKRSLKNSTPSNVSL